MRCLECGHSNPESNKFCGECGARLERRAAKIDVAAPEESLNLERRDTERERVRDSGAHVSKGEQALLSSVIVKAEFPPATPEQEAEEERADLDIAAEAVPKRRARAAGISGPSILGLGYETAANPEGFVYDKPRRDGFIYDTDGSSPEYLLDEAPRRSVSWRAWALFAVLAIAGGLVYLQWRANRGEGPNLMSMVRGYAGAGASKLSPASNGSTAATNPTAPANNNNGATAQPPTAANTQPTDSQPAAQPNSASAPTEPEQATENQASTAASNSTLSSDSEDGDRNDAAASAPAATAKQPTAPAQTSQPKQAAQANQASQSSQASQPSEASQTSDEDNGETPSTPTDEVAKPESDQPSRSTAKPARPKAASRAAEAALAASPKPKPLGDKDPLIVQAENYIQGRGRPKNCSAAVNLLRQSVGEGNPAADVKLGALYWTGTCVKPNKVTAYQWFTRAHTLEPTNRWIERSRTSMWASMNEREKQLATGY